ncbi:glycosyltransferase family 4 protein [Magnetofaba australis]|nr:glycosyltransferase family 4 protein [Magnetofaba australis]
MLAHHGAFPQVRGGVDAMLNTLAASLPEQGARVSVFNIAPWTQPQWTRHQEGEITVHSGRLRPLWDPKSPIKGFLGGLWEGVRTLWRLRRLCREESVDVIHLFTCQTQHAYFTLLRLVSGPRYVITYVGSDILKFPERPRSRVWLLRWIASHAHAITAVAEHLADAARERFPHLRSRIRALLNGVDLAGVVATPEDDAEALEIIAQLPARFALQVACLDPIKAQDAVIQAWEQVQARHPDLHLVFMGTAANEPPQIALMNELMARNPGRDRIHVFDSPPRAAALAAMRRAEMMIHPSRSEGLPFVLLECGAFNLPGVFSRIRPYVDLLDDGKEGLLATLDDPDAIAAAMNQLADDPLAARAMGRALGERVRARHDARVMAKSYFELYCQIVE